MVGRCGTRYFQGVHIVLCMHVSTMLWAGLTKALGVLLPTLREQFTADTWMIGSLIAASVAAAGFAGPGLSIICILTRAMAGRQFTTGYAIATGVGSSGHALGMMFIGPLAQVFLDTYGWRGALLLLGAISLHLCAFAFLLTESVKVRDKYVPIVSSEEEPPISIPEKPNTEKQSQLHVLKAAITAGKKLLGCSVCGRAEFWIAFPVFGCDSFATDMWLMYFVAYADTKGFSGHEAVTFTLAGGIGNMVSKIIFGLILGRGLVNVRLSLFVTITSSSLALLTLTWINSYWAMMVNAFLYHGLSGMLTVLSDIYTRELLGTEDLAAAFSWIGVLTAVLVLAFGFFPGLMFDISGSFEIAFVILACIASLSLVSLLAEVLLNRHKERSL
ncbi:monocarboxylate transporter 12-like isoform X2 [Acanthaster planci]|uniref:Monocarboxylate transporter 12-like isoform X2 n=1 Tax=Acanthaster planci TaxID=133434 RepID=A0A8B7Z512_ACAPL|nr:monocarboxylate transporter 12-like isoform X2 [Acanthaster planci]